MAARKAITNRSLRPDVEAEILTGKKFDAMTDAQRALVVAELEAETPAQRRARSKPLNAEEHAWWKQVQKKLRAGRPKLGKNGTKIVSVTVEKSLLRRADAFAKANGLNRSKLFAISDEAFVKSAKLLFSPGNSIILR